MLLYLHLSLCFRSYEAILHGPPNFWGPISGVFRPAAMAAQPTQVAPQNFAAKNQRKKWWNQVHDPNDAITKQNLQRSTQNLGEKKVTSSLWTTSEFSWNIKQGSKDFWVVFHNSPSQMKQFLISSTPHFFAPKKKVPRNVSPHLKLPYVRLSSLLGGLAPHGFTHLSDFSAMVSQKRSKPKKKLTKEAIRHKWVDSTLPLSF